MSANRDKKKEKMEKEVSSDEGDSGVESHQKLTINARDIRSLHTGDIGHQENHYYMAEVCRWVEMLDILFQDFKRGSCLSSGELKVQRLRQKEEEAFVRAQEEKEMVKRLGDPVSGGEHHKRLLGRPFVGREWLFELVEEWLEAENGENVLLLTGPPGMGKSSFAAQLVRKTPCVVAVHSVLYQDSTTRNAELVARGLVRSLAESHHMPERINTLHPSFNEKSGALEIWDGMWHQIKSMKPPKDEKMCLIIVDGLDEGEDPREERRVLITVAHLVALVARKGRLPFWMRILCLSRSQKNVQERFEGCPSLRWEKLDAPVFAKSLHSDIEMFIHELPREVGSKLMAVVGKTTNFLVVTWAASLLQEGVAVEELEIRLRKARDDPIGALLLLAFERLEARIGSAPGGFGITSSATREFECLIPLLSVLVATSRPLNENQLFQICRLSEPNLKLQWHKERLRAMEPLVIEQSGCCVFFHALVREWLTLRDGITRRYAVMVEDGEALLIVSHLLLCARGVWRDEHAPQFLPPEKDFLGHHPGGVWLRESATNMFEKLSANKFEKLGRSFTHVTAAYSGNHPGVCEAAVSVLKNAMQKWFTQGNSLINQFECRGDSEVCMSPRHGPRDLCDMLVRCHRGSPEERGKLLSFAGFDLQFASVFLYTNLSVDKKFSVVDACRMMIAAGVPLYTEELVACAAHNGIMELFLWLFQMEPKLNLDTLVGVHLGTGKWFQDRGTEWRIDLSEGLQEVKYPGLCLEPPLSMCARKGHLPAVRFLVEEMDVNVDAVDEQGQTALMLAAGCGRIDVVRWMLFEAPEGCQANVCLKDHEGRSAVIHALLGGHRALGAMLLDKVKQSSQAEQ